jgi:hypothetical protein
MAKWYHAGAFRALRSDAVARKRSRGLIFLAGSGEDPGSKRFKDPMHSWVRPPHDAVGQRQSEPRRLERQLWARDRALREPRSVPGENTKLVERKIRKNAHLAEAKPNAPLLKRIVRHPYPLDPAGRGKRQQFREAVPWAMLQRDRRSESVWAAALRERIFAEFPNRIVEAWGLRTIERPRASVDAWLAGATA